ncbi:MAG TPA: monovalent cation/H(+) antiporter subunit G [Thermotogota bacterium]|nr:monovalent cation/H(+) antiporter subunit G [Thermotogota bacterium]HPJ88682.1 monovalent cation/H(+) antiporter subunit G [Thermotogota bacterium]HPR95969.1 monovalent cation/H(+) antiporter subunit G [Thermotogota bacterium]
MAILSVILKILGLVFLILGTYGIIRQKEIMIKLHFSGISDTVGIILVLFSFLIDKPELSNYWILLIVLLAIIGPISGIAISKGYLEKNRRK